MDSIIVLLRILYLLEIGMAIQPTYKIPRRMNSFQIFSWNVQFLISFRAVGHQDNVVMLQQLWDSNIFSNIYISYKTREGNQ